MENIVYNNYNKLVKLLKKNRFTHNLSSHYYNKLNKRFTIPTITISGLISIAGFLSSADFLPETYKIGVSVSIGILGAISTAIQSMLHATEYGSKKKMFENAASDYDKLLTQLILEYTGLSSKKEYEKFKERMNEIEKEILKITNNCKYLPPLFVIEKWTKEKHLYLDIESPTFFNVDVNVNENTPLIQNEVKNDIV